MEYRRDIDGLRALAIIPVVLFHAGVPGFSGGFVGVDVFFVISGFLITGIIAKELSRGTFTLAGFYARRCRRILPSLFMVLTTCLIAGFFVLGPAELRYLGKLSAATTLFASNIALYREVGYFDIASEFKPLLMTWSLGVEEQFYFCWPLLMMLALRRRGGPRLLLASVGGASFLASIVAVEHAPSAAFFLLPMRAWELILGAALALGGASRLRGWPPAVQNAVSLLGLALVAGAVFAFDERTPFPGVAALLPCVGAAALIWAGEQGLVNRALLASEPMVTIGRGSYSLYLWHWPILSFLRIVTLGELNAALVVAGVATATLLSYATWRYVEVPFRKGRARATRTLVGYGSVNALVLGAGMFFVRADGLPTRLSDAAVIADRARHDHLTDGCLRMLDDPSEVDPGPCVMDSDRSPKVVLWGDSHAAALASGIRTWAQLSGSALITYTANACPPLPGLTFAVGTQVVRGCREHNERVLESILADRGTEVVVLAGRWAHYAEGTRFGGEAGGPVTIAEESTAGSDSQQGAVRRSLLEVTRRLSSAGRHVFLVGPVPEVGIHVPDCLMRREIGYGPPRDCSVPKAKFEKRNTFVNRMLREASSTSSRVTLLLPEQLLCRTATCVSVMDGQIMYYDDNHLTVSGARLLSASWKPLSSYQASGAAGGTTSSSLPPH